MKKVVFYVSQDESDVYEYPDDATDIEIESDAYEWMANNVSVYFDVIEEDTEE